ncbi:MAG TPA: J domain-containing protein [Opitutaceae bacterium]|nr:J domain-containing protein [Opitutaceae bacterium]
MPVDFKDYYTVLGVSREASAADIKQAFRKLARQYHPDVAKDKKSAEAKFKEINEAHEVLSDPDKRRKYDELGANWQQGGPSPGAQYGWNRGSGGAGGGQEFHFGGTGFSDFFEQFFGGNAARGQGRDDVFRQGRGGAGAATDYAARGNDIEGDILVTLDEAMHGSMRSLSLRRTDPRTGATEKETFKVRIPPGAQEGRRIRVPGKGGPGMGGGPDGDLFLRVRLAAHPDFEVRGADLYHTLDLAPWEAVLGAQVVVPTLSGTIKLRVPAGVRNGQQFRVRSQGLPQNAAGERGDLYAVANIAVPATITAEERELWEKLADTSRFKPRDGDGSGSV